MHKKWFRVSAAVLAALLVFGNAGAGVTKVYAEEPGSEDLIVFDVEDTEELDEEISDAEDIEKLYEKISDVDVELLNEGKLVGNIVEDFSLKDSAEFIGANIENYEDLTPDDGYQYIWDPIVERQGWYVTNDLDGRYILMDKEGNIWTRSGLVALKAGTVYVKPNTGGELARGEKVKVGKTDYYIFDEHCYMMTGLIDLDGDKYYARQDGRLKCCPAH